jgi:hypothetical protein
VTTGGGKAIFGYTIVVPAKAGSHRADGTMSLAERDRARGEIGPGLRRGDGMGGGGIRMRVAIETGGTRMMMHHAT